MTSKPNIYILFLDCHSPLILYLFKLYTKKKEVFIKFLIKKEEIILNALIYLFLILNSLSLLVRLVVTATASCRR